MKFEIKQVNLTDDQHKEIDNCGGRYPDYYNSYLDLTNKPSVTNILAHYDMYETKGFITADDVREVFHIGNIWEGFDNVVENINGGMHSISIGDLIIDANGSTMAVDKYGFLAIPA